MPTSISYASLGNAAHAVSLTSTVTFAVAVGWWKDSSGFFDEQWQRDGFCVTASDVPYWNSHDACLYVDTIMAIVVGLVDYLNKHHDVDGAHDLLSTGVAGIFVHGLGHGVVGYAIRQGMLDADSPTKPSEMNLPMLLGNFIFWMGLSRASMPNLRFGICALAALVAAYAQLVVVPLQFGFTYVQTVLMVEFSLNQMARPKDQKESLGYALYPVVVGIPLTAIGWIESTCCTSFVRDWWYGHLAYDAYIPVSMLMWYTVVRIHSSSKQMTSTSTKLKEL